MGPVRTGRNQVPEGLPLTNPQGLTPAFTALPANAPRSLVRLYEMAPRQGAVTALVRRFAK